MIVLIWVLEAKMRAHLRRYSKAIEHARDICTRDKAGFSVVRDILKHVTDRIRAPREVQ
jgi:hypothetical protein